MRADRRICTAWAQVTTGSGVASSAMHPRLNMVGALYTLVDNHKGGAREHVANAPYTRARVYTVQRHNREARMSFGEWLDTTLDNEGIASRVIAEWAEVDDSTVSRWRAGASLPSMQAIASIARLLNLDWQRLAVTASVLPSEVAGPNIEPYPMPKPTAKRQSVKRQIARIKGLSPEGRDRLLETYDELMEGDSSD